ncbi:unnamed protein product [Effrenium voratum]|uniref:Uncharacterized protein n=1 Tax=Effrenium voratum TaxID=2562239 RepID=A0AA36JN44_9DINO|nr:unnamed protein product [Effrenium voratum]CAJ1437523.1 unnamed protein product [Effrenium voratum]
MALEGLAHFVRADAEVRRATWRPLDVAALRSSLHSSDFQSDLSETITASQVAAHAVTGRVSARAITVAPILHTGVPAKPLWKAMGITGWRLSEVLLFLLFAATLAKSPAISG